MKITNQNTQNEIELVVGQYIPVSELEKFLGIKEDDRNYGLSVLGLQKQIYVLSANEGDRMLAKREKGGLRILYEHEVTEYLGALCNNDIKRYGLHVAMLSDVDKKKLDEEEIKRHDRRLYIYGRVLKAIVSERKTIRIEDHKRGTPVLCDG